jgi:hypothetical protein
VGGLTTPDLFPGFGRHRYFLVPRPRGCWWLLDGARLPEYPVRV